LGAACHASLALVKGETPPEGIPIQQLLLSPDHCDFPWKVRLFLPILTYQQRYLVKLTTAIDSGKLLRNARFRDLHYIVKVADENGKWFSGQSYRHLAAPSDWVGKVEIDSHVGVLLRPGTYLIAMIVYDSVHRQSNVWRRRVNVATLINDPLPQLDLGIPSVYFSEDIPSADSASVFPDQWEPKAPDLYYVKEAWTFGPGISRLPVRNGAPLVIDVVVNLSPGYYFGPEGSETAYRENADLMLQMVSVLSGLSPAKGCVRVSVLDILRQVTLQDRTTSEIDWEDFRRTVNGVEYEKIDVKTLAVRTRGAEFFRDFLERLAAEPQPCGLQSGAFRHVVIVVSTGLVFPHGSQVPRLSEEGLTQGLLYYLHLQVGPNDIFDQIDQILHPVRPTVLRLKSSLEFRKAIARIIAEIEMRDRR
jgi:hypothetical protein